MGQQKVAQLLCLPKVSSPVAAGTGWVRLIIYLTCIAEKGNQTKQAEWPVPPEMLLKLHEVAGIPSFPY